MAIYKTQNFSQVFFKLYPDGQIMSNREVQGKRTALSLCLLQYLQAPLKKESGLACVFLLVELIPDPGRRRLYVGSVKHPQRIVSTIDVTG